MRFAVVVVALVASFLSSGYCQIDCALPEIDDFVRVVANGILSGDNADPPTISISDHSIVCLAYSEQRDRYTSFSVVVEFTCVGFTRCPDGTAVEQFEGQCNSDMTWGDGGLNFDNTRTPNPTASLSTTLREDCAFCFTSLKASSVGIPPANAPDEEHHCVACDGCDQAETPGQNRCYNLGAGFCCRVYDGDMCDTECDDITDLTTFQCLSICPNDRGVPGNGTVGYSNEEETDGGFRQGTVATVDCNSGFMGGGNVICQSNGNWSDELPTCQLEPIRVCDDPPSVENAFVVNNMTTWPEGSTAMYDCDDDYYFADGSENSLVCTDSQWPRPDNIKCVECETIFEGCKECGKNDDGKSGCVVCDDGYEMKDDGCNEISGGSGSSTCLPCILVPIAVLLAIILAIIVAVAVYVFYRWKNAPPTNLKAKDPEGINGVARDNPLYLDPTTVAEEVEG